MLCPSCRRQLSRSASSCGYCGLAREGAAAPLDLVLPDGTRVPVVDDMTLGRAPGSTLQLADPTVSRTHARIGAGNGGPPVLEDVGSSAGTFVDDTRLQGPVMLRDGARIRLGTFTIGVERQRDQHEAGRTIVVRPGASMLVSAVGAETAETGGANATQFGFKPRVRSGYALKRLDASESRDGKRYVLRDLRTDKFLRLSDRDAKIFEQLDGQHSLMELIGYAEQEFGGTGSARVARLLADLGERGFLAGVESGAVDEAAPRGRLRRAIGPHVKAWTGVGGFFDRVYDRGGWVLFTRPVLLALALVAAAGVAGFTYLVAGRYGTPFVVADKLGLGGLIFLLGRFTFVAIHELAHGLTMASFGRRVNRVGFKAFLVIPYAFVDTSEAWFEPRRRRIAISAAGPTSDFAIGGLFSVLSVVVDGTLREVFFQLAFGAYVGGLFNLNPFLDRDGYHIMVDVLRQPGLRARAKAQFERRAGGDKRDDDDRALRIYSVASIVWLALMGAFVVGMSLRYQQVFTRFAPEVVVDVVMYSIWVAVFLPFVFAVGKPLRARMGR